MPACAAPRPASAEARLLAIAADHLRRLGPDRLTVVGVAAEAGMTHAAVYRYFPSRAALVEAVAERWLRGLEAALGAIADAPDPADDKLERLLLALSARQREALEAEPHLFAVHAEATAAGRPIARRHRTRLAALVDRVVEEGVATGVFAPGDRERALGLVFDAGHRFIHPASIRLDAAMPRSLVEARLGALIAVVRRALRMRAA